MTDATIGSGAASSAPARPARRDIGLSRRYAAERRFKLYGILAVAIGLVFLAALLWSVASKGYTALNDITTGGSYGCDGTNQQSGQPVPGAGIIPYATSLGCGVCPNILSKHAAMAFASSDNSCSPSSPPSGSPSVGTWGEEMRPGTERRYVKADVRSFSSFCYTYTNEMIGGWSVRMI